jgi:hypothetical protein
MPWMDTNPSKQRQQLAYFARLSGETLGIRA